MRPALIAILFVELLLRGALVPHSHARSTAFERAGRPHVHLHRLSHGHAHHHHHGHAHHHDSHLPIQASSEGTDHDEDIVYLKNDPLVVLVSRFKLPDQLPSLWMPVALEKRISDKPSWLQATWPANASCCTLAPRLLLPHLLRI